MKIVKKINEKKKTEKMTFCERELKKYCYLSHSGWNVKYLCVKFSETELFADDVMTKYEKIPRYERF